MIIARERHTQYLAHVCGDKARRRLSESLPIFHTPVFCHGTVPQVEPICVKGAVIA